MQRRSKRRSHSRSRSRSRRRSVSPRRRRRSRSRTRSRSPRSRSRSRSRDRKSEPFSRSLGGPINAEHDEAVEMAKNSKRENRVYVGNLSYDVKYRDLMEFMRGGGWGNPNCCCFSVLSKFGFGIGFSGGDGGCRSRLCLTDRTWTMVVVESGREV